MKDPLDKIKKARERAARRERRKLERLRAELSDSGDLSDWEAEFSESVTERLDRYGSAFHDPEKGAPSDALSYAQKKIMSDMRRKAKDARKAARSNGDEAGDNGRPRGGWPKRGQFNKHTRDRHIETDDNFDPEPTRCDGLKLRNDNMDGNMDGAEDARDKKNIKPELRLVSRQSEITPSKASVLGPNNRSIANKPLEDRSSVPKAESKPDTKSKPFLRLITKEDKS